MTNRGEFLYDILKSALNSITDVDFIEKYTDANSKDEFIFVDMSGVSEQRISERPDEGDFFVVEIWVANYVIHSGFKVSKTATAKIRTLANARKDKIDEKLLAITFPKDYTHDDGSDDIYTIRVTKINRSSYISTPADRNGIGLLQIKGELIYEFRKTN